MRRSLRSLARAKAGTTAVEFALVCFPLLFVIFGTLELGRGVWANEALQETAIAGARCMGLVQSSCGTGGVYNASMTQSYVQSTAATWSIPLSSSNIALSTAASCAGIPGFSQVSITYTFTTVVPLFLTSIANGIPLTATACFPNNAS